MKASALRGWLSSHIEIMEKACGAQSASGLRRMSEVLAIRPDATVTEVCKVLNKVEQCGESGLRIGPLADLFRSMAEAACMFAKVADANDLKRFAATIESKRNEPIDAFVSQASVALAPRPTPADPAGLGEGDLRAYLQRLEEARGDERNFDVVYHQLSNDRSGGQEAGQGICWKIRPEQG